MRIIQADHKGLSTILAFALIPLSGFATDIYIPSLPSMAGDLHVSSSAVQLSLIVFMVSSGISQLFVGTLLDSFGRYRLNIAALIVFALASFTIARTHSIYIIYAMRVVHGITVAMIVVSKRAYFVDIYSGEKLKHYISLFSIVWATAPIVAPFLGGYLQANFGWQSNFYFLGFAILAILVLELIYGGESLKTFHPFNLRSIGGVYGNMIRTADFGLALIIISLSYSMLVVYGMTSPFIIEHVLHYSPVVTGECALFSGVALMTGGMISKSMIKKPLLPKIMTSITLQVLVAGGMIATAGMNSSLFSIMPFVILLHLLAGFTFNNLFSYCLGRFSKNAGIAAGVTGGSLFIITSFFSYGIVDSVTIKSQALLGGAYLTLALLLCIAVFLFARSIAAITTPGTRESGKVVEQ